MISDELARIISKTMNYDLEKTKLIFQDYSDKYIKRAIEVLNKPTCMRVLTSFLEEYTEDLEVLAHLRGFENKEEQIAYWEKWDREIEELK